MTAWRMAFRDGKNGREMWPDCHRLGVAAIQYGPVDDIDLSRYSEGEPKAAWSQLAPNQKASLKRLVYKMQERDVIYVKQGPMIVGKGVVTGPYQFDNHKRIRVPNGAFWEHQRPVQWIPEFPEVAFQLGAPQIVTVVPLTGEQVTTFEQAVSRFWLSAEEADESDSNDDASYSPQEGDRRQVVERQIRERRGQKQFRDALRKRYRNRCVVTGCEVLAVLEAAHINPYRGENDNHSENGLLLRADIHTLFDLDLLAIEPVRLQVELHPDLAKEKEYGHLGGKTLGCAHDQTPSQEALRARYEQFQKRVHRPA